MKYVPDLITKDVKVLPEYFKGDLYGTAAKHKPYYSISSHLLSFFSNWQRSITHIDDTVCRDWIFIYTKSLRIELSINNYETTVMKFKLMKKAILYLLIILTSCSGCKNTTTLNEKTGIIASTNCETEGTCSGDKYCSACKNCKYCKNCSKNGGTCGVCK